MGIITIAFDDCYADVFEHCAAFLAENKIRATFAVPSACIGGTLENRSVMTKDQLVSLIADGHEIASHTTGHRNLLDIYNSEGEEAVLKEMTTSKGSLQTLLGIKVESFVFPFITANHNERMLDIAAEHYLSSRITAEGFAFNGLPPKAPFSAVGTPIMTDMPMSEYDKLVEIVSARDLWLIEVFHLVSDKNTKSAHRDAPYRFFTLIDTFRDHICYILSKKVPVMTQGEVVRRYRK